MCDKHTPLRIFKTSVVFLNSTTMEEICKDIEKQLGGKWNYDRGEHLEDVLREMGEYTAQDNKPISYFTIAA